MQRASLRTSTGLKTIYAAGATSSVIYITPPVTTTTSATSNINTSQFTANIAGTPTFINWTVDSPLATITAGKNSTKASVQLQAPHGATSTCTIQCQVQIDGVLYTATATKTHTYTG